MAAANREGTHPRTMPERGVGEAVTKPTVLEFDTAGLSEEVVVAYQQGIIDCLDQLGVEFECDETPPDLSKYVIQLSVVKKRRRKAVKP
jgi:hypothetical protein